MPQIQQLAPHVADLIEKILKKKVSGVGLHLEGAV